MLSVVISVVAFHEERRTEGEDMNCFLLYKVKDQVSFPLFFCLSGQLVIGINQNFCRSLQAWPRCFYASVYGRLCVVVNLYGLQSRRETVGTVFPGRAVLLEK